jgi:50S ribosomal protein L16 3-hydroxylase
LLDVGDMLYLPPGVPHDGVAFGGPCMTYSIGMRAPSHAELVGDLADYLAERLPDELRYADPDLSPVKRPGEIGKDALARLRATLTFATGMTDAVLLDWFGRFITRYRNAQAPVPPEKPLTEAALTKQLTAGASLLRHPWARFAWAQLGSSCTVFVNGHAYRATSRWAQQLCAQRTISPPFELQSTERTLLLELVNDGHLVLRKLRNRRS